MTTKSDVRQKYADLAKTFKSGGDEGCCGSGNYISRNLYDDVADVPEAAVLASLGCGNPIAVAELHEGETVLDLGSGGGIDVILSARRVGPTGKAYGVDMTDEMLELARENQRKAGVANVEFLKGDIENVPLPAGTVDVVISNCVINLSLDKKQTLTEAFRVLRPGGRFAVADIVTTGELPVEVRRDAELWVGCIAGALEEADYKRLLTEVGFQDVAIEPVRVYGTKDPCCETDAEARLPEGARGRIMSAFVRARKP